MPGQVPHLPVTPVKLMRSGGGKNAFCTVSGFAENLGLLFEGNVVH